MKYSKVFTEYSNNMQDVYKNIKEYNLSRKCNALLIVDNMIAFIRQSYFAVSENIRPKLTLFYYENSKQTRASTNRI